MGFDRVLLLAVLAATAGCGQRCQRHSDCMTTAMCLEGMCVARADASAPDVMIHDAMDAMTNDGAHADAESDSMTDAGPAGDGGDAGDGGNDAMRDDAAGTAPDGPGIDAVGINDAMSFMPPSEEADAS